MFGVLERVQDAESLTEFTGELYEALGARFDLRHTTCFTGPTYDALFDPRPRGIIWRACAIPISTAYGPSICGIPVGTVLACSRAGLVPHGEAIAALGARVLDPTTDDVVTVIAKDTDGRGADAVFDTAGVTAAVATGLACLAARSPFICVAVNEKPIETPLLSLLFGESRMQGSLGYTSADFDAVIELMAAGHCDTTGWVTTVPIDDVVTEAFDALHAGKKMKVLIEP